MSSSKNIKPGFFQSLKLYFSSVLNQSHMHVRTSERGRRIINDKELAQKVVRTIQKNRRDLSLGRSVPVPGEKVSVKLVTTIKEANSQD